MKIQNPKNGTAVTPSDTVNLAKGGLLYVGVSGDVKVTTIQGTDLTFKAHPVGYMPVYVEKVFATGTTATDILVLFND